MRPPDPLAKIVIEIPGWRTFFITPSPVQSSWCEGYVILILPSNTPLAVQVVALPRRFGNAWSSGHVPSPDVESWWFEFAALSSQGESSSISSISSICWDLENKRNLMIRISKYIRQVQNYNTKHKDTTNNKHFNTFINFINSIHFKHLSTLLMHKLLTSYVWSPVGAHNLAHAICRIQYCLIAFEMRFLPHQAYTQTKHTNKKLN
jgi:hypothetical protein